MNYGAQLNRYQSTNVQTSGGLELVILCYEKIIHSLHQAKRSVEEKDYESKFNEIQRAINIINELQVSLNMEKGGDIAANLDSIYTYITRILTDWDMKRNPGGCDEAIRLLSDLKDAWEQISHQQDQASMASSDATVRTSLPSQMAI
jgi:flagellar protein FliS